MFIAYLTGNKAQEVRENTKNSKSQNKPYKNQNANWGDKLQVRRKKNQNKAKHPAVNTQ